MGVWVPWRLFWLGVWESLQLHRCVVLLVLDDTNQLWAKVVHSLILNGCVFLGSVAWWIVVLQPLLHHLIFTQVAPLAGSTAAGVLETMLHGVYHACWLVPVYVVTLAVSCSWYNEMATIALQVLRKHKSSLKKLPPGDRSSPVLSQPTQQQTAQRGKQGEAAWDSESEGSVAFRWSCFPTLRPSARAATAGFEETAAQELFRVVLFLVFYGETWIVGQLSYIGQPLYFIFSCWLCAYYCFDYAWALNGISLSDRLAFFESSAPFFAGFGLPMTLITLLLPFYIGAGVTALLFPLFVLVACHSDPPGIIAGALCQEQPSRRAVGASLEPRWPGTPRVPIFAMAMRPTKWLLHRLLRALPGTAVKAKTT